jgi:hypothetical protein
VGCKSHLLQYEGFPFSSISANCTGISKDLPQQNPICILKYCGWMVEFPGHRKAWTKGRRRGRRVLWPTSTEEIRTTPLTMLVQDQRADTDGTCRPYRRLQRLNPDGIRAMSPITQISGHSGSPRVVGVLGKGVDNHHAKRDDYHR